MWIKFFIVGDPIFEFDMWEVRAKGQRPFYLHEVNDISHDLPVSCRKEVVCETKACHKLVLGAVQLSTYVGGNVVLRLG